MASESSDFSNASLDPFGGAAASSDDIFSILEALEGAYDDFTTISPLDEMKHVGSHKSISSSGVQEFMETEVEAFSPGTKRQKVTQQVEEGSESVDGCVKLNHVTVERNRRKTMNEHLAILRSLMPCFYVKRVSNFTHLLAISFV